ncbi:MAG: hypothetical protein KAG66_05605 [Methylococcales bacterium]|nr:hypothetical protein [Methylococcales bacterium]
MATMLAVNLKTPVGRGKDMEDIGVLGESEKFVVTLLVMRDFSGLPGTPKACVDFRDPTEVSRFKPVSIARYAVELFLLQLINRQLRFGFSTVRFYLAIQ